MRRFHSLPLGIFLVGLCWWVWPASLYAAAQAVELPSRFVVRTVVSGLDLPTDMVILPSGDFLVTEKGTGSGPFSQSQVRLVRQAVLQPTPVLTLRVNSEADSGLFSIVLDHQFASNHYFYLWYSTGEGALGWQGETYNRLSRFVYDATSGTADPVSETIILDEIPWSPLHNGGGLAFDAQGNLLVATGDAGTPAHLPTVNLAQDVESLNGKVLRIRPRAGGGYDVPSDNPFRDGDDEVQPEIYALGLRNPFRMTQRLSDQNFYLLDVGQETWEEVNQLVPGVNYGWPYREGRCQVYGTELDCVPTPPEFTDPVLVYPHPVEMGAGVTAMAFYEGTQWPPEYQGKLFVADFNSNWVGMMDLADPNQTLTQFATGMNSLVDMEATPEGLYAVSIYDGTIQFLYYDESSNLPPSAQLSATPIGGKAPLFVEFTAVGSQDGDGDVLQYGWNFGDGSALTTTTVPTVTHVYTQDGTYLATLQVTDELGAKSEIRNQLIEVYSGAYATVIQENLTEPGRTLYRGGDQIRFRAVRAGDTTGLDPVTPYSWTILLHHNEHIHVLVNEYVNSEIMLDISTETHALNSPLWYEIVLSMHTASGQVLLITHELRPQTTWIQALSWPGDAIITLNQQRLDPEDPVLVIVGQKYVLEATPMIVHDFKVGEFTNWVVTNGWPVASVAGETETINERRLELVATPESKTYVAFYDYVRAAMSNFLPTLSQTEAAE
jgi:glucose/arabinose dehydrogenase